MVSLCVRKSITFLYTEEPRLSEPLVRHLHGSDIREVRIHEKQLLGGLNWAIIQYFAEICTWLQ